MHPATRFPTDGDQELYSSVTSLECPLHEDMTRQEFKAETDINSLVRRLTPADLLSRPQPSYGGFHDYDMDLQQAAISLQQARDGFARLPASVRAKFATVGELIAALESGEAIDLADAPAEPAAERSPVPPVNAEAAAPPPAPVPVPPSA